jgi:hypothetical protein
MKKFLQQTTPFVLLFIVITSSMATDRGAKKAILPARRPDFQYVMPLTAQNKQAALQKIAPNAPTATEIIWQDDFENGTTAGPSKTHSTGKPTGIAVSGASWGHGFLFLVC